MPIPNDLFVPPVVSTSAEVAQIREWIAGRPVPTLGELGVVAKALAPVREKSAAKVLAPVHSPVGDGYNVKPSKQAVMNHLVRPPAPISTEPAKPVATPPPARPKFSIAAPTTVAPPPRRR